MSVRCPSCDQRLEFEVLGGEFILRDLESRNGSFLDGRSMRCCELRPGDEVLAGRTVLVFRTSDPEATGAAR